MITKYLTIFASLLIAMPVILSAADNNVIAKVGDNEVRAEDIKPFIEKLPVRDQVILSKDPAGINEFVRNIIIQQLVYKEAVTKKWEQEPRVAAQLDRIRQQAITQSYLQSLATPPADYPSQVELQSAYESLKKNNALQVPKQYRLAQIYIACPKGSDKETEAKAQTRLLSAVKSIKSGDFSDIAKSQSDDIASAQRGGDLGFLAESQIQPEIRSTLSSLSKGATSEPVRMNDGWHLVKVLEVKEPYTATFEEVKGSLSNDLRTQQAQILGKAYLAKLLQQNPVTLNEIAVSKLINPKSN